MHIIPLLTLILVSLLVSLTAEEWKPVQKPGLIPTSMFEVDPSLEVTVWATSPMLYNPTNMDIDHEGRFWVTEGVNYRGRNGTRPNGDRIVVLQDGANKQMVMKKPDTIIEQSKGKAKTEKPSDGGFALANMFGAVPVMAAGTTGFKLNDLSAEIQSLADIREGDVVIGVDGASMRDIMSDPSNWQKFSTSTNLPITVFRDGEKQIIYINASSLSAKMMPNLGFKP